MDLAAADGLSFNRKINCTNHLLTVDFVVYFILLFFLSSPSTSEACSVVLFLFFLASLPVDCLFFVAYLEVGEIKLDFNIK